ncbi:MAG TPA: hypothetical protein QGG37_03000 [Chloroflexota bacterium]|nr:hypothetical protein [Chloroflexota bacterium]
MQSSLIGKIEKAHRYAEEPERISIHEFRATFRGGNGEYNVEFAEGAGWQCTCNFYQTRSYCSHTMALEKLLNPMVPIGSSQMAPATAADD